jgi:hypothetical protein
MPHNFILPLLPILCLNINLAFHFLMGFLLIVYVFITSFVLSFVHLRVVICFMYVESCYVGIQ